MTGPATQGNPIDSAVRRHLLRASIVLGLVGTLASGLVLGLGIGFWARPSDQTDLSIPAADSVDVGFAQDMSAHHNQAVEMSSAALTKAVDPAVRTLAFDVLTTQQSQVGTMQGWLSLWNRPASATGGYMTWMTTDDHTPAQSDMTMPDMTMPNRSESAGLARMPGMATPDELRTLRSTTGPSFDGLYLQLLLRHHEGGLSMARYGSANASIPAVAALASNIVAAQSAESETIKGMLAARNIAPLPLS